MSLDNILRECIRDEVRTMLPDLLTEISTGGDDEFVDTAEAARITGLSESFFNCGRSSGNPNQPRHYKIGRRVLYRRGELLDWVQKRAEVSS